MNNCSLYFEAFPWGTPFKLKHLFCHESYAPNLGLLPDDPVAVGGRWEVSGKKLEKLLRPDEPGSELKTRVIRVGGKIEGRLEKVAGQTAHLSFSGTAEVEYEVLDGEKAVMKGSSRIRYDGTRMEFDLSRRAVSALTLAQHYEIQAAPAATEGKSEIFSRTTLDLAAEVKTARK